MEKFWTDNTLHVIATYFRCPASYGTGKVGAARCPDCKGVAWIHATGEKIKAGKPSEVRTLERPTMPESAAQYDEL